MLTAEQKEIVFELVREEIRTITYVIDEEENIVNEAVIADMKAQRSKLQTILDDL